MGSSKKGKKLKLNKETLKDLTPGAKGADAIKGGRGVAATAAECSNPCPATYALCPHKTTLPAGCPTLPPPPPVLR